jgi:hypothetical protein
VWTVVVSTVPAAGFPGRFSLFGAASLAVALAGCLRSWGWPDSFQQPVHHWRLSNSNRRAVSDMFFVSTTYRESFVEIFWILEGWRYKEFIKP